MAKLGRRLVMCVHETDSPKNDERHHEHVRPGEQMRRKQAARQGYGTEHVNRLEETEKVSGQYGERAGKSGACANDHRCPPACRVGRREEQLAKPFVRLAMASRASCAKNSRRLELRHCSKSIRRP